MQRFVGKSVFGPTGITDLVFPIYGTQSSVGEGLACVWAVQESPVDMADCV